MTLFQFYKEFDTEKKCVDYLIKIRWGGKIICPVCSSEKYYNIQSYNNNNEKVDIPRYKCANNKCYNRFTVKSGTMFHSSNVPLVQFFFMMFSAAVHKKNVSSIQQGINLGITQKTAWYIMMRIRMMCFQDEGMILSGIVEIDECYVAKGKWNENNKGWDRAGLHFGKKTKAGRRVAVLGLIERGGQVVVKVVPGGINKKSVEKVIFTHVEVGSTIYTDGHPCYQKLNAYYRHDFVNHRAGIYVKGEVHTNTIESFWKHTKVAIVGTHHAVSLVHLQSYCDELAYRHNTKGMSSTERFNDLLKKACRLKTISNANIVKHNKRDKKLTELENLRILEESTVL